MARSRKSKMLNGLGLQIADIKPRTEAQIDTFDAYREGYNLILHGAAGTGKSFIGLYLALSDVIEGKYHKVVIVRSVVPSRDMGFLPGSIREKCQVYEAPYVAIVNKLFNHPDAYHLMSDKGYIEFVTTSFERGIEFDNAAVFVDEIQNMNFQELDTTITRVGQNCKVILAGDIEQTDLYRRTDLSGLPTFLRIVEDMESFDSIEFAVEDIVRSGIVKEYLLSKRNWARDIIR